MAGQSANLQGEIQLGAGGIIPSGSGSGSGISGNIEVVDTLTCEPDEPASVENMGTSANVKLRFTIPRGHAGEKGDAGESGVYIGSEEPTDADIWIDDTSDSDFQEMIERLKKFEMLVFDNITVPTSSFVPDATYETHPFVAIVPLEGVTSEHFVDVVFSPKDSMSGILAPVASTATDCVLIYASEVPTEDVSILTIECRRTRKESEGTIDSSDVSTDAEVNDVINSVFI